MALIQQGLISGMFAVRLSFSNTSFPMSSPLPTRFSITVQTDKGLWRRKRLIRRVMVQEAVQGISSVYAKEMERLSAKESLILAFNDAGGLEALVTGKITDVQRIDVNERITVLERLNPTPRPTTSPYLEGRWAFEWFGSNTPGSLAAKLIFERFPSTLVNLSNMDIVIKDANTKATAKIKLLNSIESKIILSSKITVEGPLRMKEAYLEGMIESPLVIEEAVPEQLRGVLSQAVATLQQLPVPIKDILTNGLRIPLGGSYQRFFMISYLDDEILIIRDMMGVPDVLTRVETSSSTTVGETVEYNS